MTNSKFFTRALRRQLLHRPLPAVPRIRPVPRRADRVELRHRGQAREPVPELHRQRNDGRRRAVDRQRRLLEHVVPGVPGVDRGAQLPRQPHRLPAAGQDGRELPPRDEGPGADRRGRCGRAWAARLAELRDPAVGGARQQVRPPGASGASCPPARRQEPAQPRDASGCSCCRAGSTSSCSRSRPGPADLYDSARARRASRWPASSSSLFTAVYFVLVERLSTGFRGAAAASTARSTTSTSGGTSASGRCPTRLPAASSTARRSRPWSGGCWASGSAGGCSTTAPA